MALGARVFCRHAEVREWQRRIQEGERLTMSYAKGYDTYAGDDNPETPQVINFYMAKLAGMDFVFIKARQGSYGDPLFTSHWERAKAAGLARGAYDWLSPTCDPQIQAVQFVGQLGGDFGELPLVVDYEQQPIGWPQWPDSGRARTYLKEWLETVKRLTKTTPMIYTGPSYWQQFGGSDSYWGQYYLWLAQYSNDHKTPLAGGPKVPAPWKTWDFWQYGDKLDGLAVGLESKDGDYNYFNGDMTTFNIRFGLAQPEPPPEPPAPPDLPKSGTLRITTEYDLADGQYLTKTEIIP